MVYSKHDGQTFDGTRTENGTRTNIMSNSSHWQWERDRDHMRIRCNASGKMQNGLTSHSPWSQFQSRCNLTWSVKVQHYLLSHRSRSHWRAVWIRRDTHQFVLSPPLLLSFPLSFLQHSHKLLQHTIIITVRNEVANVIFTPVCLSMEGCLLPGGGVSAAGGSASVHAGIPTPPPAGSRHPREQTPPGAPPQMATVADGMHATGMHSQGSHFFYPVKFPDFSLIS